MGIYCRQLIWIYIAPSSYGYILAQVIWVYIGTYCPQLIWLTRVCIAPSSYGYILPPAHMGIYCPQLSPPLWPQALHPPVLSHAGQVVPIPGSGVMWGGPRGRPLHWWPPVLQPWR
uniref:Uncharacterized protein n=1 Tax=Leptobrachium leishanense TaxID=445787 RepID=A0A8C5LJ69_9ANUR